MLRTSQTTLFAGFAGAMQRSGLMPEGELGKKGFGSARSSHRPAGRSGDGACRGPLLPSRPVGAECISCRNGASQGSVVLGFAIT